jgi:hypothetical protein
VNFGAGSQMQGQLGYTNKFIKAFELTEVGRISKPNGAIDDTETLSGRKPDCWVPSGAPRAPRADRAGFKRARRDGGEISADTRMVDAEMREGRIGDNFYD